MMIIITWMIINNKLFIYKGRDIKIIMRPVSPFEALSNDCVTIANAFTILALWK
jgi:hypothetical protein